MLSSLVVGAGSGYLLKVLQTICSLLLLPFVISDDNLGLEAYGWLVSLLVIQAFVSMILDGWRLNVSKLIGEKKDAVSTLVSQLLVLTFIQVFPFILIASVFADEITAAVGVDVEFSAAIYILSTIVLIEQLCFILEAVHHAKLKTWRVNLIISIEVFIRTITIFLVFFEYRASINIYLYLWLLSLNIRMFLLIISASSMLSLTPKGTTKSIPFTLIIKSLPLTYKSLSSFLVLRASVIYANKYIGGEASALLSIIINTIRNYFFQALVSAMRPMIIPVASGIEIINLSCGRLEKVRTILFAYQFTVMIAMLPLLLTVPIWMPAWLPNVSDNIYMILGLAILVFMLEVQCSPINYLLVSQGHGKKLSYHSLMLSLVWAGSLILITVTAGHLELKELTLYVLGYLVIYNGVIVSYLNSRYLPNITGKTIYGLIYIIVIIALIFWVLKINNISVWLLFLIIMITSPASFNYLIESNVKIYKRVRNLIA